MKQSAFKNFVLFKPRTQYPCKDCQCSYKVFGDTWLEIKKSCKAIDGTKAFRIFWLCHNGHRHFRGYSKPVSWKKNLGGDQVLDEEYIFADQDAEEENEFQELIKHATRMQNSTTGKSYF